MPWKHLNSQRPVCNCEEPSGVPIRSTEICYKSRVLDSLLKFPQPDAFLGVSPTRHVCLLKITSNLHQSWAQSSCTTDVFICDYRETNKQQFERLNNI